MTATPEHKHALLHGVQIASPCKMKWQEMTGDERRRFCNSCKLHVYNIADMTVDEAFDLLALAEGKQRPCIRLWRRRDGTVITKDCPDNAHKRIEALKQWGGLWAFLALLYAAIGGFSQGMGARSCAPQQDFKTVIHLLTKQAENEKDNKWKYVSGGIDADDEK